MDRRWWHFMQSCWLTSGVLIGNRSWCGSGWPVVGSLADPCGSWHTAQVWPRLLALPVWPLSAYSAVTPQAARIPLASWQDTHWGMSAGETPLASTTGRAWPDAAHSSYARTPGPLFWLWQLPQLALLAMVALSTAPSAVTGTAICARGGLLSDLGASGAMTWSRPGPWQFSHWTSW